jgi:hypothetical protein
MAAQGQGARELKAEEGKKRRAVQGSLQLAIRTRSRFLEYVIEPCM